MANNRGGGGGGWLNLNEVLIRRERDNNTCSSLNIGLVYLATPSIFSHVGPNLALHPLNSVRIVFVQLLKA